MLSGLTGGKANAAATTAQRSGANRIIVSAFVPWRDVFPFWFLGAIVFGSAALQLVVLHAPLRASSKHRWRLSFCWVAVLGACACSVLFGLHALTGQSETTAALASPSLLGRTKQQETVMHALVYLLFYCFFQYYFFTLRPT
ncbi:hypothetical protein TraAM80_10218, partial [Trypanosoma rangeli]